MFQNEPLTVGLGKLVKGFCVLTQDLLITIQAEILNILVRIVQHCVEMAANICQVIIYRRQLFLQYAGYLTGSVCSCVCCLCLDKIDDSFRLRKCKLTVQECPFCKFAPHSGFGTG